VDAVATAVDAAAETVPVARDDILGPVDTEPGAVRTILRFDYGAGAAVAEALRAQVIRAATTRRRAGAMKGPRPPLPPNLRVRFDDVEPFLE
jgi:primosomal protein N' (replication factor Y)